MDRYLILLGGKCVMYSGFVLRVGETSSIERANNARHNFGYDSEDVIVITLDDRPVQIETLSGARVFTGLAELNSTENALAAVLEKLNMQEETEEQAE
jgi:hypothetical protein